LDACPATERHRLHSDICAIQHDFIRGLSASRSSSVDTAWDIWLSFCSSINLDPYLTDVNDPIASLQLFARQYRTGHLAPTGRLVGARTVEAALRAVGQTFARLGKRDPRLDPAGRLDLRLTRQLAAYAKDDPSPNRQKPIPLAIIIHAAELCVNAGTPKHATIADMLLLAFYFLLRPGEYAHSSSPDATPFRVRHAHFYIHNQRLRWRTATQQQWDAVTQVALEFDRQKNGVKGELIGLSRSGDQRWCPVRVLQTRIIALRNQQAADDTPLYSYRTPSGAWGSVQAADLTTHLRAAAVAHNFLHQSNAHTISARSLRSSGAMALFCAGVDPTKIQLFGRWRSAEMLRYLHVQALPVASPFASAMLTHGNFAMIPHANPDEPNDWGNGDN